MPRIWIETENPSGINGAIRMSTGNSRGILVLYLGTRTGIIQRSVL